MKKISYICTYKRYIFNKLKEIEMKKTFQNPEQETVYTTLFDENGNLLQPVATYFNEDEDVIDSLYWSLEDVYSQYPSNSPLVGLYFAKEYSDATHGNYSASTLFYRGFSNLK